MKNKFANTNEQYMSAERTLRATVTNKIESTGLIYNYNIAITQYSIKKALRLYGSYSTAAKLPIKMATSEKKESLKYLTLLKQIQVNVKGRVCDAELSQSSTISKDETSLSKVAVCKHLFYPA